MPSISPKLRESWDGNLLFLLKRGSAEPWSGIGPMGSGGRRLRQENIWIITNECMGIVKKIKSQMANYKFQIRADDPITIF
jgi:hypothetical protein